jgi:putative membrane protein
MDTFGIIKALHIIFIVTWFAGLFYIVRLFVYHREAQEKAFADPAYENESRILINQYKIMQKRLWYGITWPSAAITLFFGLHLASFYMPLTENPWLMLKLFFVVLLYVYHMYCGKLLHQINKGEYKPSSNRLRMINEGPTVLLFAVVFLAVLKSTQGLWYGLGFLFGLIIVLILAIRIYRIQREKAEDL